MRELFNDTSNWEHVKTKNWSVAGGESLGLGAIVGGEAKIMAFTHGDIGSTKGLLLLSASIGAKLEAEIPAGGAMGLVKGGIIDKLLGFGGHAKKVSDASGVNPLNFSPPAKVDVKTPFCLKDLEFANCVSTSAGATGGVVDAGVGGFAFFGRDGTTLFTMSEVTVQGTLGAGINMGTLQGSKLINLRPSPLPAAQQAANQNVRKNTPWKYSAARRPAGGW